MTTDFVRGRGQRARRAFAAVLVVLCGFQMAAPFAAVAQATYPARPQSNSTLRSSATKKLLLVGGAALLYYLYRKHQASVAARQSGSASYGGATTAGARPQLYRSKNGGIYYRDVNGRPVWLTVPARGLEVPADELQRYAPNYRQYRGPPTAPRGYTTQPFSQFDPSLMNASTRSGGSPL